ncbi:MAG: TIGR03619 family F420-dependent LLM class oxidoreductase [Proteobacteria bacterium]|nr:TIGR03619 family F420-dependent LLM class oxidoreductase [Pseudomonadota bacterium]
MHIGVTLRNMGPQSDARIFKSCAAAAEAAGFESLWITDHIAIPPDDAVGSGGRYLDPLVSLAVIAGATQRIKLGTGVLILPYRGALPVAKQIATLQELSGERLLLGVGIGWMDAEFTALGLDRHRRGQMSDDILEFINRCFANDVVEANGQPFLFKPRPAKPPILVGGRAPHALERAVRFADGWLPMSNDPQALAGEIRTYRELCKAAGKPVGQVSVMTGLKLNDRSASQARIETYRDAGANRLICSIGYEDAAGYQTQIEMLAEVTALS